MCVISTFAVKDSTLEEIATGSIKNQMNKYLLALFYNDWQVFHAP